MAIPFMRPNYEDEDLIIQIERLVKELYDILRVYLRQDFVIPSELVYLGTLPGVTVRVGVRPLIANSSVSAHEDSASAASYAVAAELHHPVQSQSSDQPKLDTNDPEGGTT